MNARIFATSAAIAAGMLCASVAAAQDAAESAVILSGTGAASGQAARSVGSAVSGAMGRAANAIAAANRAVGGHQMHGRTINPAVHMGYTVIGNGDPLRGTDASTYRLANGAAISVSGDMRPSASSKCVKDCQGQ